jgi:hypothetical protein
MYIDFGWIPTFLIMAFITIGVWYGIAWLSSFFELKHRGIIDKKCSLWEYFKITALKIK